MTNKLQTSELPTLPESTNSTAFEYVTDYFVTGKFLDFDNNVNTASIPELLDNCQSVFSQEAKSPHEVLWVFDSITKLFVYLIDDDKVAEAEKILACVKNNIPNILGVEGGTDDPASAQLATYLAYVAPIRYEPISDTHWEFVDCLIKEFAEYDFDDAPYFTNKLYIEGGTTLALDRVLNHVLESHSGESKYFKLVTTILARRYGFKRNKYKNKGKTIAEKYTRHGATEASTLLKIWEACSGREGHVILETGETEEEDITRNPTQAERNMRRVQKVRKNFQVLEALKQRDSTHIARKLYRGNGIANFNRYSIETLSRQYEIQVMPYTEEDEYKMKFLSILPYSDYNGAFESEHYVINKTQQELYEVIIEAGSRKKALVSILRSVKGTASRQQRNQNLYHIPFEYIYVAGHSNNEEVELGKFTNEKGIKSNVIDIPLIEDQTFYEWLSRHMLIDRGTIVILGGCKTAEDKGYDPSWDNLAKTIMKRLAVQDVIAAKTSTYSDQIPVIQEDYTAKLIQTGYKRKAHIVSIAQELQSKLKYNR